MTTPTFVIFACLLARGRGLSYFRFSRNSDVKRKTNNDMKHVDPIKFCEINSVYRVHGCQFLLVYMEIPKETAPGHSEPTG